jgi:hypothetical protein
MKGPCEAVFSAAKTAKTTFSKPLVGSECAPWLQMSKWSRHKAFVNIWYSSLGNIMQSSKLEKLSVTNTS